MYLLLFFFGGGGGAISFSVCCAFCCGLVCLNSEQLDEMSHLHTV